MAQQKIRTPTGNDIRLRDAAAQGEASRHFYINALSALMDQIEQIGRAAREGETVVLVDQWGEETPLVLAPTSDQ